MAKISINLLPPEFTADEVKRAKFYKIQVIGIAVVLAVIFLSSLTVSLRILQSQSIKIIQGRLSAAEEKITGLKGTQAKLTFLKSRLTVLGEYLGTQSKTVSVYKFLTNQIPPSILVDSVSVDKFANILMLIHFGDVGVFDNFIANLLDPEKNEGLIKTVSLDSLNRGRDGLFRASLKIQSR